MLLDTQIECSVEQAARELAARASALNESQILVAGGEPTVRVSGYGIGGRCSELAVRFAALSPAEALFASSDGVDGNSSAAGIYLPSSRAGVEATQIRHALAASDSYRIAAQVGEPIMIAPTGNNCATFMSPKYLVIATLPSTENVTAPEIRSFLRIAQAGIAPRASASAGGRCGVASRA